MTMVVRFLRSTRSSSIFGGADGIQRGTRLIEKQDFRFNGQGARDAQTLLLSAGKVVGGFVELILHFLPQGGVTETLLDDVGDGALGAVDARTVGDVVKNGFGKRIGALEDHADAAAKSSDVLRENILAVEKDFTFQAGGADGFVHAIEDAEESGFAAAGRADESSDSFVGDAQVDVEENLLGAIEEIEFGDGHAHGEAGKTFASPRSAGIGGDVQRETRFCGRFHG